MKVKDTKGKGREKEGKMKIEKAPVTREHKIMKRNKECKTKRKRGETREEHSVH